MVGETSRGRKDNYRNVNALCLPSDLKKIQLRLAIHSPCNFVSDIDINNCNRLFWIRNYSLEALLIMEHRKTPRIYIHRGGCKYNKKNNRNGRKGYK